MKLNLGGASAGNGKQSIAVIALLVLVIGGAGFFALKTMMGPSGGGAAVTEPGQSPAMPGPGGDPNMAPVPPPGGPMPPAAPPESGPQGAPPPAGPAPTQAAPQPQATPAPQAASKPAPAPQSKPVEVPMRQIKVFGSVSISYPSAWKIAVGGANNSAVFTNGKAAFEVHPPDPKATTAQAIAQSTLKKLAPGATVVDQGADKIAGHDTYWIAARRGGQVVRIVGVDAPTRVALYEYVKGGQFSAYRDLFNKMQSGMSF